MMVGFLYIFLILCFNSYINYAFGQTPSDENVSAAFINADIVPKFTPTPPERYLNVVYGNNTVVDLGTKLTPIQTLLPPTVFWDADPDLYYTFIMQGDNLDRFSSLIPLHDTVLHWGRYNIKGSNISTGTDFAAYLPPLTPPSPRNFRYVQLVYEQPGPLKIDTVQYLTITDRDQRISFDIQQFIAEYNLGDPIFGNFFHCNLLI